MKEYLLETISHPVYGGVCMLFKFPNLYGASVVRHKRSLGGLAGLFELAPLEFDTEGKVKLNKGIDKNNIGYLFWEEVVEILYDIKSL